MPSQPSTQSVHYLFACDGADMLCLHRTLAALPEDSYGHVFLELTTSEIAPRFQVPRNMTIHQFNYDPTRGIARGQRLVKALQCWRTEWMPEHTCGDDYEYRLWVGCHQIPEIQSFCQDLRKHNRQLQLHHPMP